VGPLLRQFGRRQGSAGAVVPKRARAFALAGHRCPRPAGPDCRVAVTGRATPP